MRAYKEMADTMLEVLHRNRNRLSAEDYDRLYTFIKQCRSRLPKLATLEKDQQRKSRAKREVPAPEGTVTPR